MSLQAYNTVFGGVSPREKHFNNIFSSSQPHLPSVRSESTGWGGVQPPSLFAEAAGHSGKAGSGRKARYRLYK